MISKIESILFIAARPLNVRKLTEIFEVDEAEVEQALRELGERHEGERSGLRLLRNGRDVQLATSPDNSSLVQAYLKDETTGELTRPSLEALTIIAYRGPVLKEELEQIRGVNCSLILRNLMMRGLVETVNGSGKPGTRYRVTIDFLRFLGLSSVEQLPDYDKLRSHENIVRILDMENKSAEPVSAEGAPTGASGTDGGDD